MSGLTVAAPAGSHFEFEQVKTAKGTQSLGDVPILVFDTHEGLTEQYGDEGIIAIADGTSLRVSFQNIARRYKNAGKTDDEIAAAQVAFRPGKRQVGASTPGSRAARSAKQAVEKLGSSDAIEKLLAKIASGDLSEADIEALTN